jgi:hypothetical protein
MKIAFIFPPIWPLHVDGSLQIWNREITESIARAAREMVCDEFSYKSICSLLLEVYQDVSVWIPRSRDFGADLFV